MNILSKGLLAFSIFGLTATAADAQIYVNIRPPRPRAVVVRPVAPSPRHVWVEEDWAPAGRGYRWRGGYWSAPPRQAAVWVPGHWRHTRRGDMWIPGRWR
jgi:hypothetical protein